MSNANASLRRLLTRLCILACFSFVLGGMPGLPDRLEQGTPSFNLTITNATSLANDTISAARRILDEAMIQQGVYNRYRFAHPRRNSYKPGQRVPLRRRDAGEPEAPHLNATVLAASALLAQHDAKAAAANGTLHKSYPPLSHKADDTDASPSSSDSDQKRAIENDWWVPAIKRDGLAPMGAGSYAVQFPSS
jgi:hypothetical protein